MVHLTATLGAVISVLAAGQGDVCVGPRCEADAEQSTLLQHTQQASSLTTARELSRAENVECPGSPGVSCQGNQCCPGVGTSGNTFPCPSADADWNDCAGEKSAEPYRWSSTGPCSGGSTVCETAGWVYCQDATCSAPTEVDGVLVAKCLCWAPGNTNNSILPDENGGASCVINQQRPQGALPQGGTAMCDAMKAGSLISTYGPQGWKPPLVVSKCEAQTQFAWCWGAPCSRVAGDIICDCPMVISESNATQYLSMSTTACANEPDPCKVIHNSSPAGSGLSPQAHLTECSN